jgi:protein SCO1/2
MRRVFVIGLALMVTVSCQRVSFRGTPLEEARPVPSFALLDQHGRTFRFDEQRGRVLLIFFGYTRCPDVCPLTLGTFKRVATQLGNDAANVRFIFVTVDPEQDTPAFLDRYLRLFRPDFVGLTGTPAQLSPVYEFFRVGYKKVPVPTSAVGYLMAHSVHTAVIDRQGRWRLTIGHEATADDIEHDVRQLLRH